jgi:hypothetical protein
MGVLHMPCRSVRSKLGALCGKLGGMRAALIVRCTWLWSTVRFTT